MGRAHVPSASLLHYYNPYDNAHQQLCVQALPQQCLYVVRPSQLKKCLAAT